MGRRISISNGLISAIAIAAVAAVAIRAALVVSRSDGGWEILRDHFVAGLPPVFGLPANQVHPRLATADSLLREANRIAADPHSTAADLMGAAGAQRYAAQLLHQPLVARSRLCRLFNVGNQTARDRCSLAGRLSQHVTAHPRISPRGHKSGARPRRLVAVKRIGRV